MSDIHNVFISHRHEDDGLVAAFKDLMKNRNLTIRDSSITTDNPNAARSETYIKSEILAPNIRWAGKVVVIITPDTKNHSWVGWEVDYAEKFGDKEIIGVWAPGHEGCELPDSLKDHADAVVSWDAESIAAALNGERTWQNPNGDARPAASPNRLGC